MSSLVELLRHQNDEGMVRLLENASSRIECTGEDNFGDGWKYYTLFLEIPIERFAPVEGNTNDIESKILQKVQSIIPLANKHSLTGVQIKPKLKGVGYGRKIVSESESSHIWDEGCLKVFLSHASAHKKKVVELKVGLKAYCVSAFVAHEDIEPSRKWQKEIELALRSMDAFVPLLTDDFHQSNWTDQEVGIAVGLDAVIIPIRLGCDPYGFIGENQGLSGQLGNPNELAKCLIDALLVNDRLGPSMQELLVGVLEGSESFIDSIRIYERLKEVKGFSKEQIERLRKALKTNDQIYGAYKVPRWIEEIVSKHQRRSK